jgi:hypothetical protein
MKTRYERLLCENEIVLYESYYRENRSLKRRVFGDHLGTNNLFEGNEHVFETDSAVSRYTLTNSQDNDVGEILPSLLRVT